MWSSGSEGWQEDFKKNLECCKSCEFYVSKKTQEKKNALSNWSFFISFFFLCLSSVFIIFHSHFWLSSEQQSSRGHRSVRRQISIKLHLCHLAEIKMRREREEGEGKGGGGWKRRLELGRGFDFTMQSIFWNNLFAGKNLLKQGKKYLASLIRIWYFGVLAKQTFIDIALVVLKIFKVVKPTPSPWNLTQSKPFRGQRKQWSGSSNSFLWFTF